MWAQGFCCTVSVAKAYPAGWYSFQIIVGSIFPMLMLMSIWVLYNLKRPSKVHILMFSMLIWTCVARTVWIWLDPFATRRIIAPWIEQVIYGNGLWSLLAVYITVLGLWYYIWVKSRHLGNADLRNKKTKRATLMILGVLVFFLVTNTTLDVIRTLPQLNRTTPRIIALGFYLLNIAVMVGVPGILYFTLGRNLEGELTKFNSINGTPQVQDGYIKKITYLTTSSCIIAFSTLLILIAAFVVLSLLSAKGKLNMPTALGFHVLYRILEISYMLSVMGIFYFKVNTKPAGGKYVRMR
jgi:hypothetical protein